GMTSLLSQTKLTEEQQKFTETIRVCGENLMTIINDILDFSKIEAQNMELEFQPFALKSAVNEIVELFSVQAAKKSLSIKAHLDSEVPDFIVGDVTRIKQVIINLVNNAIKFTDKGEIRIRISKYSHASTEDLIHLLFQVQDTGIGIEESKISRLFTAFSQVDSSIARKYGGTGLGLAICQKLVHLMNGRIWVNSRQGEGSVFSFTSQFSLPTAAEIEKLQPKAKAQRAPMGQLSAQLPLRILVAEDNAINMQLILHLLKKLGYKADAARNGQEAVDAVERQTYDIIFMDMQMPVMDGLDASRQIVAKYPENLRPTIIALTANVSNEDKENCLAAGMADFVTKPLKPVIVRETLIKWGKTKPGTTPRRATS
ncbi:MAG: response regulator, partial [Saprospiraceae bacterium]|nr:response regulator [Saprospiraceae bacterium]